MPESKQQQWLVLLAALLCAGYKAVINTPYLDMTVDLTTGVLSRTLPEPYRFRVAGTYLSHALARLVAPELYGAALIAGIYALNIVALILFLLLLRRWLGYYAGAGLATALTVVAAGLVAVTPYSVFTGWTWTESALIVGALLWLRSRAARLRSRGLGLADHLLYLLLVVMAVLNKESGVYLAFLFAVAAWHGPRREGIWSLVYLMAGFITYLLLRVSIGAGAIVFTFPYVLSLNLASLPEALINLTLLLGPLWYFAWHGYAHAPPLIRRLVYSMPVYLTPIVLFGLWRETRLLVPLFPILMALAATSLREVEFFCPQAPV